MQVDHTVLSDFKSTRSRDKHWLCSHERLVPAVSINSTERSSFIAKWVVLRVSFLFLHNRTWIPALSPWPSPLAQAAGPRPHEGTSNLTTPRWALSPASSSVSDPKLPPPTLPQGRVCVLCVWWGGPPYPSTLWVCVSCVCVVGCPLPFHTVGVCILCGGVSPIPFHMVAMCLLCGGVPHYPSTRCVCVCVCVWWVARWPFHMVGVYLLCVPWGPPYPSTQCVCMWWGAPGPSTWWVCTFCVWWGPPYPST